MTIQSKALAAARKAAAEHGAEVRASKDGSVIRILAEGHRNDASRVGAVMLCDISEAHPRSTAGVKNFKMVGGLAAAEMEEAVAHFIAWLAYDPRKVANRLDRAHRRGRMVEVPMTGHYVRADEQTHW